MEKATAYLFGFDGPEELVAELEGVLGGPVLSATPRSTMAEDEGLITLLVAPWVGNRRIDAAQACLRRWAASEPEELRVVVDRREWPGVVLIDVPVEQAWMVMDGIEDLDEQTTVVLLYTPGAGSRRPKVLYELGAVDAEALAQRVRQALGPISHELVGLERSQIRARVMRWPVEDAPDADSNATSWLRVQFTEWIVFDNLDAQVSGRRPGACLTLAHRAWMQIPAACHLVLNGVGGPSRAGIAGSIGYRDGLASPAIPIQGDPDWPILRSGSALSSGVFLMEFPWQSIDASWRDSLTDEPLRYGRIVPIGQIIEESDGPILSFVDPVLIEGWREFEHMQGTAIVVVWNPDEGAVGVMLRFVRRPTGDWRVWPLDGYALPRSRSVVYAQFVDVGNNRARPGN